MIRSTSARVGIHNVLLTAALLAAAVSCSSSNTLLTSPVSSPATVAEVPATNLSIDQTRVLASHNAIRQRLGVPPLSWSTNLESLSAEWANFLVSDAACSVRRRGSVGLPAHKNGVGENIQIYEPQRWDDGRVEVANVDEDAVVVEWARQALDYNYTTNKCAVNKDCDNYTQVVWRDSQVLGCAAASCPGKEQIWVCNYDPPGNFLGQKPY